jgi:lipopolysaccharide export system permease protein
VKGWGLLDRWLALRFSAAYATFAGAIMFVFVVIDLFTNLEDLSEAQVGLARAAFRRYATQLPELFFVVSPFLALVSALWVVAALQRRNELTALVSSGFGPRRLTWPFFLVGLLLAPVCWADRELLLPALAHLRREAEFGSNNYEQPRPIPDGADGVFAPLSYYPALLELGDVRYTRLDDQLGEALTIYARRGVPVEGGWQLYDGFQIERRLDEGVPRDEVAAIGSEGLFLAVPIEPSDVEAAIERPSFLSADQIRAQLQRMDGAMDHLEIQLYERYTYPLAGVVLLLLGVPVVLRGRGGVDSFVRNMACLGGSFGYFVLSTVCYELGSRDALTPLVAAFLPVVACGGLGLLLVMRDPAP